MKARYKSRTPHSPRKLASKPFQYLVFESECASAPVVNLDKLLLYMGVNQDVMLRDSQYFNIQLIAVSIINILLVMPGRSKYVEKQTRFKPAQEEFIHIKAEDIDAYFEHNPHYRSFTIQNKATLLLRTFLFNIIPLSTKQLLTGIRVNLPDSIIIGPSAQCKKILSQMKQLQQQTKMIKVESINLPFNRVLYIQNLFRCKVFDKQKILLTMEALIKHYDLVSLKGTYNKFRAIHGPVYLIEIEICLEQAIREHLQELTAETPEPSRKMIKNASYQYVKIKEQRLYKPQIHKYQQKSSISYLQKKKPKYMEKPNYLIKKEESEGELQPSKAKQEQKQQQTNIKGKSMKSQIKALKQNERQTPTHKQSHVNGKSSTFLAEQSLQNILSQIYQSQEPFEVDISALSFKNQ